MSRICLIGKGQWGGKLYEILSREGVLADWPSLSRCAPDESIDEYRRRVLDVFRKCKGDVVWLATPPVNQSLMIELAIEAGKHIVVEKPWSVSAEETKRLSYLAKEKGLITGVSYIYCFLNGVVEKAEKLSKARKVEGCFSVRTKNRLLLSSLDNLGSHIVAIRNYICPEAELHNLKTAYGVINERSVTLYYSGNIVENIDFTITQEPVVQRFTAAFLNQVKNGAAFEFDFNFASMVMEEIKKIRLKESGILKT